MQKLTASLIFSTFLVGSTILSGCGSVATMQQSNGSPLAVTVTHATQGWISQGPVYIGTVQPDQEVQVLPKIPGKVSSVNVSVGSRVKKGDTLYTLDDKEMRDAVAQAQAALAAAQAGVQTAVTQQQSGVNQASGAAVQAKSGMIQAQNGVTQAQNGVTQAQNAVVQAQNGLTTAKRALDDATINKNRYEQLYAQNVIPKAQLDQYETAYVNAQAAYNNAQAAYNNAQKGLQTAQATLANAQQSLQNAANGYETAQNQVNVAQSTSGIDASKKAVNSAQAALQAAEDQLADATITSPIDGIVGVKNINTGDFVNPDFPSSEPVLVVANLDPVKILVYIPANAINGVKVGDPVMVKSVALNTYFRGQVKNISPLDNQGKGYPVEISVPNPDLQLKKGMVTEVSLLGPNSKQGILIPTAAIVHDNGKSYVYVADQNVAHRKEITVGQQEGSQTLIANGVSDGETIITNQLPQLTDGMKITIDASNTTTNTTTSTNANH